MVNLNIAYREPAPCLTTLTKELTARHGTPSRWYEFVAGSGPTTWNISSHNADNNGLAHAVDIFVGHGHNISVEQGIDLAERLRIEGTKGDIAGHPDRLAYIIHRSRIAGDHTGWKWQPYTGASPHNDHIHVSSVFDFYWGDPVWGVHASNYSSTIPWNLWATTTAKPAPVKPATSGAYTVKAGDTMTAIAAAHSVTLAALLLANPKVYPNLIHPGDKLALPAIASVPKPVVKPKTIDQLVAETLAGKHGNGDQRKKSLGANYAAVQAKINGSTGPVTSKPSAPQYCWADPGDSLTSIGQQFGVPWQTIAKLNGISPPYVIHPKQKLRLW